MKIIRATQKKFTVSAAAVITNAEGKVLLLNHVLRPFSGWGLPGGFMSVGEQPEETIRRELREETGIELEDLRMFRIRTLERHVEILFSAVAVGEASVLSREILDLGWVDVEAMQEHLAGSQKNEIKQLLG
jgi:8-oxo-dGTP diphosphatase